LTSPSTEVDPTWYETLFDRDEWLDGVARRIPQALTLRQVDFVLEKLGLSRDAAVLDFPCGHGRHSLELARRGCQVTGVDISKRALEIARGAAAEDGLDITFVHTDMREVSFDREFDAVLNLFSSFGYLETVDDDQRVLNVAARALKPGGAFLIDVFNLHWLAGHSQEWHSPGRGDGAPILERRSFDPAERRSRATWTFLQPDGGRRDLVLELRVYGPRELTAMLEEAGLIVETTWGGFDGAVLSREASRMVVLARRR